MVQRGMGMLEEDDQRMAQIVWQAHSFWNTKPPELNICQTHIKLVLVFKYDNIVPDTRFWSILY